MGRRVLAALALLALLLTGCGKLVDDAPKGLTYYATFYPIYALADALTAGVPGAALHCLVQPQDGCLRSYQLSDWDLRLLASGADAVLMGGRGLESFESALLNWGSGGPAVAAVLYNIELYNGSLTHAAGESGSHLEGPNPHLYLSVDGAKRMLGAILAALMTFDPQYSRQYADNEAVALEKLDALGARAEAVAETLSGRRVILMNEALIYPARDCGLDVAEWVDRESGEGFDAQSLQALIERLDACEARVILIEKQAPAALVEALEAAGFRVARLDVLSTHREGEGFDAYIQALADNLAAIEAAFWEDET